MPAARARGLALLPALAAAGLSCVASAPYPSVYGDTRLPWPLNRARQLYVPWSFVKRFGEVRALRGDDLVVFQRPLSELPTLVLERRAARGRRTVLDFDDAIFLTARSRRKFRALVGMVDHVIAGNSFLAEVAGVPNRTTVIPTVVDTERFCELPARDTRGKDVVVGWTGSAVGYKYLVAAAPGIARALERTGARFRVIADRPPPVALDRLHPEFVRWRPETEIGDLGKIDVGLMPLAGGAVERGKCAYKLIQYMAIGRAAVASPVGANLEVATDGVDGCFASTSEEWERTLVRLIEDPAERRELGARARRRVVAAYAVKAVVPAYVDLFTRLGATGPTRI
ncbi:MAG: glycosyltransferase [Polyangia bacterium]